MYEADGSVVVTQGPLRLTADHVTINALPGTMVATGHVHFVDPTSDLKSERLELNVNTEAGVVTHGSMYVRTSNSFFHWTKYSTPVGGPLPDQRRNLY